MPQDLQTKIKQNPNARLNLIVRVRGDLDARAREIRALGFERHRKLELINALVVSGAGTNIESLSTEDWVVSIEEDRAVRTQ